MKDNVEPEMDISMSQNIGLPICERVHLGLSSAIEQKGNFASAYVEPSVTYRGDKEVTLHSSLLMGDKSQVQLSAQKMLSKSLLLGFGYSLSHKQWVAYKQTFNLAL